MVARLVRLTISRRMFITNKSQVREEWVKVVRQTNNWINLSASWDQLCLPAKLAARVGVHEFGNGAAEDTAEEDGKMFSGKGRESASETADPSGGSQTSSNDGDANMEGLGTENIHPDVLEINVSGVVQIDDSDVRAQAVARWVMEASKVTGLAKKKKTKKKKKKKRPAAKEATGPCDEEELERLEELGLGE